MQTIGLGPTVMSSSAEKKSKNSSNFFQRRGDIGCGGLVDKPDKQHFERFIGVADRNKYLE